MVKLTKVFTWQEDGEELWVTLVVVDFVVLGDRAVGNAQLTLQGSPQFWTNRGEGGVRERQP